MKLSSRKFWDRFIWRYYVYILTGKIQRVFNLSFYNKRNKKCSKVFPLVTVSRLYGHIFCEIFKSTNRFGIKSSFPYFCILVNRGLDSRTAYGRTLFSDFGFNVWRNHTEIAFYSNRSGKISFFSTESTIFFLTNVITTRHKPIFS